MTTDHSADDSPPESADIELLRLIAAADPVPAEVVSAAKASLTWLTIDAELAELSFDSLESSELVGTRAAGGPRTVSFEYRNLSIEIEIDSTPSGASIIGQVAPAVPTAIELARDDHPGPQTVTPDAAGRFSFAGVHPGRARMLLRFAAGDGPAQLLTEWMTI